ncbi:MAG: ATP synthase F1 subunit epsilon [Chloroflexi bacterium]|nr:MAG: ATP synthase F1 subunit epsilon [Chloroflexota bacterium]
MPFSLRVVSVEASLFEGDADFVLATGGEGELGILPGHAPLLTTLAPGPLRFDAQGKREEIFVGGGFMEVLPDRVTVLADVAERAEDISVERAEQSRKEIQDRLSAARELTAQEKLDMEAALAMAEARLRVARMRRGG